MKMRIWAAISVLLILGVVIGAESDAMAKHSAKNAPAPAATPADPIIGLWYTEGYEGGVQFYSCDSKICGRFYWLKNDDVDGDVSRDTSNPDADKRGRPLCGLTFMTGFVPDNKGKYTEGTIYSPRHGANFSAEMTLVDNGTLTLRGFMLTPLLGQTQTWKRADAMPKCHVTDDNGAPAPAG